MKPVLMHCSYHKCLTVYFSHVVGKVVNAPWSSPRYRHFNSLIEDFKQEQDRYRIASVNNHCLDLSAYPDYRVTRFMRDPRDMIISGYFYHKRGAEPWCDVSNPVADDWKVVNGNIPEGMRGSEHSYTSYLQSLSTEEGLLAEIEFRKHHYESMRQWNTDDPHVKLFKYEDILGNEGRVMQEILSFMELAPPRVHLGAWLAHKNSASQRKKSSSHVRDPSSGQWKKNFTPTVEKHFNETYGDVLEKYAYL